MIRIKDSAGRLRRPLRGEGPLAGGRAGRGLRADRPERRRQDDDDARHARPARADLRRDRGLRRGRPRAAQGRLPDHGLHARLPARLRGPDGLGVPRPVRRELWAQSLAAAARHRRPPRYGRADREARGDGRRALARDAAADDARQDADPRPACLPARRAGQRDRPPGPHPAQEHPPPARRGEEDGADLVAHPLRDERILHVGRDHGEGPDRRRRDRSTRSTSG